MDVTPAMRLKTHSRYILPLVIRHVGLYGLAHLLQEAIRVCTWLKNTRNMYTYVCVGTCRCVGVGACVAILYIHHVGWNYNRCELDRTHVFPYWRLYGRGSFMNWPFCIWLNEVSRECYRPTDHHYRPSLYYSLQDRPRTKSKKSFTQWLVYELFRPHIYYSGVVKSNLWTSWR